MRTDGLTLRDTQYTSRHIQGVAFDVGSIDLYSNTQIKITKKYNKEFRYFMGIGKQPKYTPVWRLKQIIKKL